MINLYLLHIDFLLTKFSTVNNIPYCKTATLPAKLPVGVTHYPYVVTTGHGILNMDSCSVLVQSINSKFMVENN